MAMKPEPMDLEGEMSVEMNQSSSVYPLQLIQNETNAPRESDQFNQPCFSYQGQTSSACQSANPTMHQMVMSVSQASGQHKTVSQILLGQGASQGGGRGRGIRVASYPPYAITREEVELNSKFLPKKYKCGLCIYKTSYKSDLNRHMRRHVNNKEIPVCKDCSLTFSSPSALLMHQKSCPFQDRMTMADLPNKCDICPYTSAHRSDMNRHIKCHLTYDYACDICFKPFKVMALVDHHKLKAHKERARSNGHSMVASSPITNFNPYRRNDAHLMRDSVNILPRETVKDGTSGTNLGSEVTQIGSFSSALKEADEDGDQVHSHKDANFQSTGATESGRVTMKDTDAFQRDYSVDRKVCELGDTDDGTDDARASPASADLGVRSQQRQSRVRELLSLNSGKQESLNTSLRQFCCEMCRKLFSSVRYLLQHKKTCNSKSRIFRCPACFFQTTNSMAFKRHKRKHSAAAYSCECCNQPFMIERNLVKHKPFCRLSTSRTIEGQILKVAIEQQNEHRDVVYQRQITSPSENQNSSDTTVIQVSKPGEVLPHPPSSGRYARLISDFDEFAMRPYACALCFYRSSRVEDLTLHTQNHLTGCNMDPVPESARFKVISDFHLHSTPDRISGISASTDVANTLQHPVHSDQDNSRSSQPVVRTKSVTRSKIFSAKAKYEANPPSFAGHNINRNRKLRAPHLYKAFSCSVCGKQFTVRSLLRHHLKKMHKNDMDVEPEQNTHPV